jgi:hypothetical protein
LSSAVAPKAKILGCAGSICVSTTHGIAKNPPVGLPVSNRLSRQRRFSMIQRFATKAAAIMRIATAAASARYKFVTTSLPSRCVAFRIRCLVGAIIWTK